MEIVRRVRSMREICKQARTKGQRIGFVPTMGFLHQGHLALIRKMSEQADLVVVSIFVNPTQFGPEEDYERYPRDLTRDTDLCIREGVDYLFVPEADEIYPPEVEELYRTAALVGGGAGETLYAEAEELARASELEQGIGAPLLRISSVQGQGLDQLLHSARRLVRGESEA